MKTSLDPMENASEIRPLTGKAAITKLQELVSHESVGHFITRLNEQPFSTRPMSVQKVDDNGNFWFLSSVKSNKNRDVHSDPKVHLLFSNTSNYEFLSIYGTAEISKDRKKIDEIWTDIAKAWFPEGKEDPDASVIIVTPEDGFYWDTKDGKLVSLIKIVASAVAGKTFQEGVEGNISAL